MKRSAAFFYALPFMALAACSIGVKPIKVLAVRRSVEKAGGHYSCIYALVKEFSDSATVDAGFFVDCPDIPPDTALMLLRPASSKPDGHYILAGQAERVMVDFIGDDFWEGCETGRGTCDTLVFTRPDKIKNWLLIMPCGGTETSLDISGITNSYTQQMHLLADQCPPSLDLSSLPDGLYKASMMACGLGGTVHFRLVSK